VSSLAAATLNTSEAAVSRTLGQAQACADALTNGNWQLFDVVRDLGDRRREAAAAIMTRLGEVLIADEHVVPLKSRLAELERDAMQLLAAAAPAPVTPPSQRLRPPLCLRRCHLHRASTVRSWWKRNRRFI
jgi:hypothetical protein